MGDRTGAASGPEHSSAWRRSSHHFELGLVPAWASEFEYTMYRITKNGRPALEADACGIGFLATLKGVAERGLVEHGLDICRRFDHRGALGHGAGVQLDIPWPMLLDRFPDHAKSIAQRDVALGMFFLPHDAVLRSRCVAAVEELVSLVHAEVLEWQDVPVDRRALPADSDALRTMPVVRQALFRRPKQMGADAWLACRYLLRLALDTTLCDLAGEDFTVVSLSNRTVVYKGLTVLSKIDQLYPDLRDPGFASRYLLFHSRYCTNTTTHWRRAQPFWAIAHNGEIATVEGNVAWVNTVGKELVANLRERYPELGRLSARVRDVICSHGSDTANLDDMLIALLVGGMSLPQAILALLPEASSAMEEGDPLRSFYRAMRVYLGACDGPAAIVACDGTNAVAHLDRNGLRPLWVATTRESVLVASEMTDPEEIGPPSTMRILGPGDTVTVDLVRGQVMLPEEAHQAIAREPFIDPSDRVVPAGTASPVLPDGDLNRLMRCFGMTAEDLDLTLATMGSTGKPPVGAMGDDTPLAAMLDAMPRRLEDYFKLRFAQETSPPIDPVRDAWVFCNTAEVGHRSGLWQASDRPVFEFPHRVLSLEQLQWLTHQQEHVRRVECCVPVESAGGGFQEPIEARVAEARSSDRSVVILTDRSAGPDRAPLPMLRVLSRLHRELSAQGLRQRVGIVVDTGVWDIDQCALMVAMGADAVCPWLGLVASGPKGERYLEALRSGFTETMSMMGVTPSAAYCGARLVEVVGLDRDFVEAEFGDLPVHLSGITENVVDEEWLGFHREAYGEGFRELPDVGEYRHTKGGRPHANDAVVVRTVQMASGYSTKGEHPPGSYEAYRQFSQKVSSRVPITVMDCLEFKPAEPISIDEVEPVESIAWRFMAPGMSEGALSEPAHRNIARAMNALRRWCAVQAKLHGTELPPGVGPVANSGEGGFDKARIGTRDGNRSIQYAGGRFTVTPMTAATALEAEVKFAQGAKPGKGGQLPGRKVSPTVAQRRGCLPGYELVSPPINHNLYSIEDVKLMLESWRHLNPDVNCALKFVATYGVELVCLGGVNAGANRLHISDGCGGTGAAKRVDVKHAGIPAALALPKVHDLLVEEGVRHRVEISADGGIQTGRQALKAMMLGADRVGFGTTLLIAMGCSMLRQCNVAGVDEKGRHLGCAPGVATQDPVLIAKYRGKSRQVARVLLHAAREIRELMAEHGMRTLAGIVGRRDLLQVREDLEGKSAMLDLSPLVNAPSGRVRQRDYAAQTRAHLPRKRSEEHDAAEAALAGGKVQLSGRLDNEARCVGVQCAGQIAREMGDTGLEDGHIEFRHAGAAGHFYAAYCVEGMDFRLEGVAADSCMTAAYGGKLVIVPKTLGRRLAVVGNTFGYGARGGRAYLAGPAGNRFGICLRRSHEGSGMQVVVEGVEANSFQYMTGGTALVLGPVGVNLGSGMTGGVVYLLDPDPKRLNQDYVGLALLDEEDTSVVKRMLQEHLEATGSPVAEGLLAAWDPTRFQKVVTVVEPEDTSMYAQLELVSNRT